MPTKGITFVAPLEESQEEESPGSGRTDVAWTYPLYSRSRAIFATTYMRYASSAMFSLQSIELQSVSCAIKPAFGDAAGLFF